MPKGTFGGTKNERIAAGKREMKARKNGRVIHGNNGMDDSEFEFRRQARLEMLESKVRKATGKQQSLAGAGKLSKGDLARLRKKQKKEKNKSKKIETVVVAEVPEKDEGEACSSGVETLAAEPDDENNEDHDEDDDDASSSLLGVE